MKNYRDLAKELSALATTNVQNEKERQALLTAAIGLVLRLQKPWERVERMVWQEPITMLTLKVALDMDLFKHLENKNQQTRQAAEAIGADVLLVRRICRVLVCQGILKEVDVDTFANTEFSRSLVDHAGLRNGIQHFYDVGLPQVARLPGYLRSTGWASPQDHEHPPFESIMSPDTGRGNYWTWLNARPHASAAFNAWLGALKISGLPPWSRFYPVQERLLDGFEQSGFLLVDVGGGNGSDLHKFAQQLPRGHEKTKLILQELPQVIEEAKKTHLDARIQLQSHDFFDSQPPSTQGARAYFMAFVLHDWPDEKAVQILHNLRSAMRPGYSRLLIHEAIIPARAEGMRAALAVQDINMMSHFASLERTKEQWRELLERAGLSLMAVYKTVGNEYGILEAEVGSKQAARL